MKSIDYFLTGVQYLEAAKVISREIIKHDNTSIVISKKPINYKELSEKTQYSNERLILPLMFNFYHGLELMIKGFTIMKNCKFNNHDSNSMVSNLYSLYPQDKNLIDIFSKHIFNPYDFIKTYMSDNNIATISKFYESLRYPEDKFGSLFDHFTLKHNLNIDTKIFEEIVSDVDTIIEKSAITFHKYEK